LTRVETLSRLWLAWDVCSRHCCHHSAGLVALQSSRPGLEYTWHQIRIVLYLYSYFNITFLCPSSLYARPALAKMHPVQNVVHWLHHLDIWALQPHVRKFVKVKTKHYLRTKHWVVLGSFYILATAYR